MRSHSHWTSYFFTGSLAIIVSWALALTLSGCRVGDRVVYPSPTDLTSGYYASEPSSIAYTESLNNGTTQQTGDISQVPSLVSDIITDPVALQLSAPGSNDGVLFAPGTSSGFSFTLGSDQQTVTASGTLNDAMDAWGTDSSCMLQTAIAIQGKLEPLGATPNPVSVEGNEVSLNGRFAGTVVVAVLITDQDNGASCASALQKISDCYNDLSQCGSTTSSPTEILTGYEHFFSAWTDTAAGLTAADLAVLTPNVEDGSLSYEVQYE